MWVMVGHDYYENFTSAKKFFFAKVHEKMPKMDNFFLRMFHQTAEKVVRVAFGCSSQFFFPAAVDWKPSQMLPLLLPPMLRLPPQVWVTYAKMWPVLEDALRTGLCRFNVWWIKGMNEMPERMRWVIAVSRLTSYTDLYTWTRLNFCHEPVDWMGPIFAKEIGNMWILFKCSRR